ncbi:MAG: peptidoglycan DD-metalloendopeptidase family protein [Rhizobiaceae bacterium]|nr:peptidoglycan DD-metalloendopeptidase family protein [Rhizobiaceae bacterium]MCV0405801.1 peptidoglycan DD-metalloendopeptidase family protein [Rhizobiaceae bacterium]
MHEVDASFRQQREKTAQRRRSRRRRRFGAAAIAVLLLVAAGGGIVWWYLFAPPPGDGTGQADVAGDEPAEDAEERDDVADLSFVPAILDLAGDPLIISIGGGSEGTRLKSMPRPEELVEPGISDKIQIMSDSMLASSERFMTALPSSPEDFAFFQAQSARVGRSEPAADQSFLDAQAQLEQAPPEIAALEEEPEPEPVVEEVYPEDDFELVPVTGQNDGGEAAALLAEGELEAEFGEDGGGILPDGGDAAPSSRQATGSQEQAGLDLSDSDEPGFPGSDAAAGWGETVTRGQETLPGFTRTRIENTTSIGFVMPENDRRALTEDFFVRVFGDRTIDSIASENGFSSEDARRIGEALLKHMELESLRVGDVVAMRGYRSGPEQTIARLVQASIYRGESYVGTLALNDEGEFVPGADPWVRDDLFHYSKEAPKDTPKRQYRLLDAIYSTAVRNNVPSGVTGEAIQLLSRGGLDLQAFAAQDDRLTIVYSETPRDPQRNTGRVLVAAVRSKEHNFQCFVYSRPDSGFSCMKEGDASEVVTVTDGMVQPVNGVLTSTYGPRKHPILKKVRIHKGVDWAAPIGTPVMAAFDGKIEFAGDNGNYGNFVRIDHSAGKASGYAHLDSFAAGMEPGRKVEAGEIIGYVGTTGLSTGPHLHFELYQGGQAINPLASAVAGISDGSAVETLVNRIIRVESAGNARAKNPLSSATGLGQFIESTWIRMMRTYRPELASSLSRADLLELRFDPTISREMVANLARESEAKLRAYGHDITAGRLYLAHFLGVDGANRVLSSAAGSPIETVVDAGVVPANPFLKGMTAGDIINWAERKMRTKGSRAVASVTTKQVNRTPPEFLRYKEAMTKLLETSGTIL